MREHERRRDEEEPVAERAPGPAAPVADVLALQRSAGNHATGRMLEGAPRLSAAPAGLVQRGALDAVKRGGEMYLSMNDIGAPFARELFRWRMLGLGQRFWKTPSHGDWNDFMLARPELQIALNPVLVGIAQEMAAKGPSGNELLGGYHTFSKDITGVRLNELESMRLTLHGCHRIEIRGQAHVEQEGADTIVKLYPRFTWIDVADLHPGTVTELEDGSEVDDKEFTAAGWDYDIHITFSTQRASTYRVAGSTAAHERGWPPNAGAPEAGFRG
jgi:hypothetical protein